MSAVNAWAKRILSYRKTDWDFDDYPVHTWKNPNARQANVAFGAGLVNWAGMLGHGESPDAAVAALRERFTAFKASNELPRPGVRVPLGFVDSANIDRYADMAEDFLRRIFGLSYEDTFLSDGSALEHFIPMNMPVAEFRQKTIQRVKETYNVDISDVYDKALWIVLEKLKGAQAE